MGAVINKKSTQIDEDACLLDPDLQSFNSKFKDLTGRAINSLTAGVMVIRSPSLDRCLSLNCVIEVSNTFVEVNEEVVKLILEQKEKIWKNKQLLDLVEDYFQLSYKTLDFCTAIEECGNRARNSQLSIQLTVQQFDEDRGNGGVGGSEKNLYSMTLKRLEKFKIDDDIFTKEFFSLFDSLYEDQISMRENLEKRENKLDKKLKSLGIQLASTLIFVCSAVPAVLIKLATEPARTLRSMGGWFNSIWKKQENDEVKGHVETSITVKELDCIRIDVDNLKTKLKALLQDTEIATREEDARLVVVAIDEIRMKSTKFIQAIRDLHDRNEECRRHKSEAMNDVLDKIKKYPST